MKVFLSWSGERSKAIAAGLRDWLPTVLQSLDPWMSDNDIEKGARWNQEISSQLGDCNYGVICLTPENLNKPWLNFEAGAISKSVKDARVCTLLYQLEPSSVTGPLASFQHTKAERDDIHKLLITLNGLNENSIQETRLTTAFNALWPRFEDMLKTVPKSKGPPSPSRSAEDIANEILEIVRELAQREPKTEWLESLRKLQTLGTLNSLERLDNGSPETALWETHADELARAIERLRIAGQVLPVASNDIPRRFSKIHSLMQRLYSRAEKDHDPALQERLLQFEKQITSLKESVVKK